ncbi:MAG: Tim44/TimA family putative adaptor protein [Pseudomonadota bacterium]
MSSAVIQLLVLAGIAIFLILRLRSVLGTREGFEKPPVSMPNGQDQGRTNRRDFEVIDGGMDRDITDHVEDGTEAAKALASMKMAEPSFNVGEFLQGARSAYEMILMAFEQGDMEQVRAFIADDVYEAFSDVIAQREAQGLTVEANFVGVREVTLTDATFEDDSGIGEVTVRFVGELTSVVRDAAGDVIEGDPTTIRRQKDVWSFARTMGAGDPNWQLTATGE